MRVLTVICICSTLIACKKNKNECTTPDLVSLELLPSNTDHTADAFTPVYSENLTSSKRQITTNQIPNHNYGVDGMKPYQETFEMTLNPSQASSVTPVLGSSGVDWIFGIALNGVTLSPGIPQAFANTSTGAANWNWAVEATFSTSRFGLDDNFGHMKDTTDAYHYHGDFEGYASVLGADGSSMILCGWAADGFPIYYKYAYSNPTNVASPVTEMKSSYLQKAGARTGDGVSAPCNVYNGQYTQDFEYIAGQGDLDECNGRFGMTPEFPSGTYYYVITEDFPSIPRYFKGTPDPSFVY